MSFRASESVQHFGTRSATQSIWAFSIISGWRKTNGVSVSVLGQHARSAAAALRPRRALANRDPTRRPRTDPRPRTSRMRGFSIAPSRASRCAPRRAAPLDQSLVDQRIKRGQSDRGRNRIAAEGAAMVAGREHLHHLARRQEQRHRQQSAAQRLAKRSPRPASHHRAGKPAAGRCAQGRTGSRRRSAAHCARGRCSRPRPGSPAAAR